MTRFLLDSNQVSVLPREYQEFLCLFDVSADFSGRMTAHQKHVVSHHLENMDYGGEDASIISIFTRGAINVLFFKDVLQALLPVYSEVTYPRFHFTKTNPVQGTVAEWEETAVAINNLPASARFSNVWLQHPCIVFAEHTSGGSNNDNFDGNSGGVLERFFLALDRRRTGNTQTAFLYMNFSHGNFLSVAATTITEMCHRTPMPNPPTIGVQCADHLLPDGFHQADFGDALLSIRADKTSENMDSIHQSIRRLLQQNRSLKRLQVESPVGREDLTRDYSTCWKLLAASNLRKFTSDNLCTSEPVVDATNLESHEHDLIHMDWKFNYSLVEFVDVWHYIGVTDDGHEILSVCSTGRRKAHGDIIQMYAKLNRLGRKHIYSNTSAQCWVNFLTQEDITNDVSCIYLLVQNNPAAFLSIFGEENGAPN